MKDARLILVLHTFSDNEWQLLKQELEAKQDKVSMQLYKQLYTYVTTAKELPSKQALFKRLYTDRPFNDHLLREAFSALYAHVKRLLARIDMADSTRQNRVAVLRQLRKRGVIRAYEAELNRAKKESELEQKGDETDHWYAMQLAEEGDQYFGMQQVRRYDEHLQLKLDELDRYYVIRKLKESCEMLNRKHIISSEYKVRLIDEVLQWVCRDEEHLQLPTVRVYYLILMTLMGEDDEKHFEELMDLLAATWSTFPKAEARNMYRYAQNYCIRKINKGERPYFGKLFHIYEELLRTELILDDGKMDRTDYKNIATVAMRFGQQDWTASFLERYKSSIPEQYRGMAYNMNMANYLYDIGSYNEALDLLSQVRFDDIFYELSARHLLLKIYYETDEIEAFTYQLGSFRVFIKRSKKLSTANKNSNLNFLKVCRRLSSLKNATEYVSYKVFKERLKKLNALIDKYDPLANKPWLLQKVQQLATQTT